LKPSIPKRDKHILGGKIGGDYVKTMRKKTYETDISLDFFLNIFLRTAHKNHDHKREK